MSTFLLLAFNCCWPSTAVGLQLRFAFNCCFLPLTNTFTWDPSVGDVASTLAAGATLCTADRGMILHSLASALRLSRATHVFATPSHWALCDCPDGPADLPDLKLLVLAGEPVPESMHRKWVVPEEDFWAGVGAPGDGLRVVNGYGVTECSVYQFRHEWSRRPGEVGLDRDCAGMPFDGVDVALGASLPLSGSACLP